MTPDPVSTKTLHRRALALAAALALGTGGLVALGPPAGAATTCRSGVVGDVNGDGHAELAVGEPGNHQGAGSVHLFYGASTGLVADASGTARNDVYLDQDSPGVPGSAQRDNRFGAAVALGDLNADGCADLAVGSPGENRGGGRIVVFFGSPGGLRTTGVQTTTGAAGRALGSTLAVLHNRPGSADDLAATIASPQDAQGKVTVYFGSPNGPFPAEDDAYGETIDGRTAGIQPIGFGSGISGGDFDGDGRDELAIGQSAADDDGQVVVMKSTVDGFVRLGGPLSLTTTGLPRPPAGQRYEGFGRVLASGDTNGDGRDELAVGVSDPFCDADCEEGPDAPAAPDGLVAVFRGSPAGLTGTGSQLWTPTSPGIEDVPRHSRFGSALAMGRLDTGATDDLLIGVPEATVAGKQAAGEVTLLLGGAGGLSTAGAGGATFTQATAGVAGTPETTDLFGSSLAVVAVNGARPGVAVIGIPGEGVGTTAGAGQITQLAATNAGPSGTGSRSFNAGTAGVQGELGRYDHFGASLA